MLLIHGTAAAAFEVMQRCVRFKHHDHFRCVLHCIMFPAQPGRKGSPQWGTNGRIWAASCSIQQLTLAINLTVAVLSHAVLCCVCCSRRVHHACGVPPLQAAPDLGHAAAGLWGRPAAGGALVWCLVLGGVVQFWGSNSLCTVIFIRAVKAAAKPCDDQQREVYMWWGLALAEAEVWVSVFPWCQPSLVWVVAAAAAEFVVAPQSSCLLVAAAVAAAVVHTRMHRVAAHHITHTLQVLLLCCTGEACSVACPPLYLHTRLPGSPCICVPVARLLSTCSPGVWSLTGRPRRLTREPHARQQHQQPVAAGAASTYTASSGGCWHACCCPASSVSHMTGQGLLVLCWGWGWAGGCPASCSCALPGLLFCAPAGVLQPPIIIDISCIRRLAVGAGCS